MILKDIFNRFQLLLLRKPVMNVKLSICENKG